MDLYFILGIIISFLLAYWGIWQANKSRTKPQLNLINQDSIPLISSFNEKLKTLDLSDYKLPFNANQYYYRGTIINSGNADIYKSKILQPVKISFPDDFKIISFNLGLQTSEVNVVIKQENECIILEWDILKPLEHFTFELIIESEQNFPIYELSHKIKIESRIADINSIKKINIGYLKGIKRNFFWESLPTYLFLIMLAAFSLLTVYVGIKSFYNQTGKLDYYLINTQDKKPVELEFYNLDSIKLKQNKIEQIISRKDLNTNVALVSKVTISKDRYLLILFGTLALIFLGYRIVALAKRNLREGHLKEILESLSK